MDVCADLHMHTVASDGTCTVEERIAQANDRGLDAIAITDHDTVPEALEEQFTQKNGVELITGCELRAGVHEVKVEILAYYIDPTHKQLRSVCERAQTYRKERNQTIVEKINAETALDLSYEQLRNKTRMLGRPHLARELVAHDIVPDIKTAFAAYLGPKGSCYVPMERVPVGEVVDAVHAAKGIASLAHPGRIRVENGKAVIDAVIDAGVDGIEVHYPYDGSYDPDHAWVRTAARIAEEHNLLETGGSDCHGPNSGKFRIGRCGMPQSAFERLRERAQ